MSFWIVNCSSNEKGKEDSLSKAKACIEVRDWKRAEDYLEISLREEESLEKRFDAWNTFLMVGVWLNYDDNWFIRNLEEMHAEFEGHPEYRTHILRQLATVYDRSRNYEKSSECWKALIATNNIQDEEKARVLRRLAFANVRMHCFEAADECLSACMELPVSNVTKMECLLDRADVAMSRDLMDDAIQYVSLIIESNEATPDLKSRAGFVLAEINEQLGNIQKAIDIFNGIRPDYPNEMVVEQRVQLLLNKKNNY